MHELSIAMGMVDAASTAAREAGATSVSVVYLRLGTFAGVVKDSLLFGFEIAAQGTLLEGARLEIEDVPLMVFCPTCDTNVLLPDVQQFRCPICATPTGIIVQGKELELTALEIPEDDYRSTPA